MILGFFWMAVANAASVLAARAVVARVSTEKPHLDLVIGMVARLALIAAAVLTALLFHVLRPTVLGLASLAALGALLLSGAHRSWRLSLPDVGWALTLSIGVIAVRLALQVWCFAPYNFDAVSYHLTKIPEWVRAEGFTRELGVDTHAPFPAGFELLETWWVVFLHHDVLIELAGVEFLALAFVACAALAIEWGLPLRWACFAGLLYSLTPGLHLSATACLNDCPVAALELASFTLVYARVPAPLLFLLIGMGIGTKPTFGYALPGLALLWLLRRKEPSLAASGPRTSLLLASLGLYLGFVWYMRNALWFGNPIYPVGSGGLVTPSGKLMIQMGPRWSSAFLNLEDLVSERIYDNFVAYSGLLIRISGWGPVTFSCGLVSLLAACRRESSIRKIAAAFVVSLVSVLVLVNHDDWCLRFVMFFPAILAIATAWFARRCRPAMAVAVGAAVYAFLATSMPLDLSAKDVARLWKQPWELRSAAILHGIDIPQDSVLFYIYDKMDWRGESYLVYGPDYHRRVVYFRGASPSELVETMDREGIQLLYRARDTDPNDALLAECVEKHYLRPMEDRLYQRVK